MEGEKGGGRKKERMRGEGGGRKVRRGVGRLGVEGWIGGDEE